MSWDDSPPSRRQLLVHGAAAGVAAATLGLWPQRTAGAERRANDEKDDVAPAEDLMREHGVLERVLLVYDACLGQLAEKNASALPVMVKAADITRHFIEDYHEKLEEEFLFPRFEKAGTLVDLVHTLRLQHQRGRALTDEVTRLAQAGGGSDTTAPLTSAVTAFSRMYRPHAAREDTVLFPAFHELVSEPQYRDLGAQFEDREHALFGASGFHGIVDQVADLEKTLGIYDLSRFTP